MDLKTRTTTYVNEDMSWLASAHGTETGDTVTLDFSLFTAGTHFPNGFIPAGMMLGKVTATGAYGPYSDAAGDGRTTLVGVLFKPVTVNPDNVAGKGFGSMLRHCQIVESKLPANNGIDANGKVDVAGRIIFV